MLEEACNRKWIWLSGCASSGKSDFLAVWGLVNWVVDPVNTLVLYTSTSLKEARLRVWGSVLQYFTACCDSKGRSLLPGKLLDSVGSIRSDDGVHKYSDKSGIHLITGEKTKLKENIGKMIGLKNGACFLWLMSCRTLTRLG